MRIRGAILIFVMTTVSAGILMPTKVSAAMRSAKLIRDHVKLYKGPDFGSSVVEEMIMGSPIKLTGKRDHNFVEIKTVKNSGWVSLNDIRIGKIETDSEMNENFNPPSNSFSYQASLIQADGGDEGSWHGLELAWAPKLKLGEKINLAWEFGATLFKNSSGFKAPLLITEGYVEFKYNRFAYDIGGGLQTLVGPGGGVGPAVGALVLYRLPSLLYKTTVFVGYTAAKYPGMSRPLSEFRFGLGYQF